MFQFLNEYTVAAEAKLWTEFIPSLVGYNNLSVLQKKKIRKKELKMYHLAK